MGKLPTRDKVAGGGTLAEMGQMAFESLPGVSTATTINDIKEEFSKEDPDYSKIGLLAAGELVGLVPVVGDAGQTVIRKSAKAMGRKADGAVSTGVPKIKMNDDAIASVADSTVTQSAVDLMNKSPFEEGFSAELQRVARENGIMAGPNTGIDPMQVYAELMDRVKNPDFKVVDGDSIKKFNEGGMAMDEQMNAVFKSSRNDVDPVSGNEVPTGSLPEEVRDDIPAQLSEGEYVVPADVVRYYGVKFFEDLRSEAKMGWQNMEQNGRVGGEPMSPEGMEMGGDELPFDISELQFVEVPDDQPNGLAEGGFIESVKNFFGAGDSSSSSSDDSSESSSKKSDIDARYEKAKKESQARIASGESPNPFGDASRNKEYQAMAQSMRDTFGSDGPSYSDVLSTLGSYIPDMPSIDLNMMGSPAERAERKKAMGAYNYAEGGYALSPGDPGYEEMGSLGLGSEGLTLNAGAELEMREYKNDAGESKMIPFLNGVPQVPIPDGYYPAADYVEKKDEAPVATQESGGGDGGYTRPVASAINYKTLSSTELEAMVKESQSMKPNAIAAAMGLMNPLLGVGVKLAIWDSSKRVERELERRLKEEDLSAEDRAKYTSLLEAAKQEKPGLLKRLFNKVKEVVDPETGEKTVEPDVEAETKVVPQPEYTTEPSSTLTEAPSGSALEPTSAGIPAQPEITTETLEPAGLEGIKAVIDSTPEGVYTGYKAPTSEKYNPAGQGDSATPLTDAFGTGNIFTSGTSASPVGSTTTRTSGGRNVGDDTDYSAARKSAKATSDAMISAAKKDLATKDEVAGMQAAATRVDKYLADKESGRNTSGQVGFKQGGLASKKKKK